MRTTEDTAFKVLIFAVSCAFAWIVWPLFGAILWAIVFSVLFAPLYRKLLGAMDLGPNLAAAATTLIIIAIVIVPLIIVCAFLLQEATSLYARIESGDLNLVEVFRNGLASMPEWAANMMRRFGLTSLAAAQAALSSVALSSSKYLAGQAMTIGQGTFDLIVNLCVMLYLLFFLLRDGDALAERIKLVAPLDAEQKNALFRKFATVIRASVKGDLLVAVLQGALGGLMFWGLGLTTPLLWAVVMTFLSLLPVFGAALVWLPVAVYLLATGAVWEGLALIAYGALVIGLVDNVLRPSLVGRDAKIPEYVVLISTLGGIVWFGFNGLVLGPVIAATFIAAWGILYDAMPGSQRKCDPG